MEAFKNILWLILITVTTGLSAQKDLNGITIGGHIPQQAEEIPHGAKRLLLNKMAQMITANGISDNLQSPRFILVPNVSVLSKNIVPSAPPKIAYALEITFYIGDGIAGNLFESETVIAKGAGSSELKAYTSAIKSIKPNNKAVKDFFARAKTEIITYYDTHCDEIANRAKSLESQGKTGEALFAITNIPVASSCFAKNNQKISRLYKKAINEDCANKLNIATAYWAASQDLESANKSGALLASIDPNSSCFSDVKKLYTKISDRVKELSDRGWEYKLMELELDTSEIEAARAIGVAYGNNQAQNITYNTRGWY